MSKIKKGDNVVVIAAATRASAATSSRIVDASHVLVERHQHGEEAHASRTR